MCLKKLKDKGEPKQDAKRGQPLNVKNKAYSLEHQESCGFCLLKFCDYSLYNELKKGTYVLPNKEEFINYRVNTLLNKNGRESHICFLFGILGSAKSAGLYQVCKSLETYIRENKCGKNIKIAYVDMSDIALKVWNTYITDPNRYKARNKKSDKESERIIDLFILNEINKQKPLRILKKYKNLKILTEDIKNGKIKFNPHNKSLKQIILIDNLDTMLRDILEFNKEKYRDEARTSELISGLKILEQHIFRAYKDIKDLHLALNKVNAGGCLATVRRETYFSELSKIETYGMDIDIWWINNKQYLVKILCNYFNNSKEAELLLCNNSHCNECKYHLTSKPIKEKQITEVETKLDNHLDISNCNIKQFLFPFTHLKKDWCIYGIEDNVVVINKAVAEYYQGGSDPASSSTIRRPGGSVILTYLDLFPIYYTGKGKIDNLEDQVEEFIECNIEFEATETDWLNMLKTKFPKNDNGNKSIFRYLKHSGILQEHKQNGSGSVYKVTKFLKFVYNKNLQEDKYLFVK